MKLFSVQVDEFVRKAKLNIAEFHVEFAQDLIEHVVRDTPVDTGFLRASWWASIDVPVTGKAPNDKAGGTTIARLNLIAAHFKPGTTIYIMNGAAYALFVHDGTSRMSPRPWVENVALRASVIAEATARRLAAQ